MKKYNIILLKRVIMAEIWGINSESLKINKLS